jgi:hypothetical protein
MGNCRTCDCDGKQEAKSEFNVQVLLSTHIEHFLLGKHEKRG